MGMYNNEQIAIIGISCRFPGGAVSPDHYWDVLLKGKDIVGVIPEERWDREKSYDPDTEAQGKSYTQSGGFLPDIDKFDNEFFKISPVETESLDPQIRLLLELSYEAIEEAGLDIAELKGSRSGVYIGISTIDYLKKGIRSHDASVINPYSITGTLAASASGRISYAYDLIGPSISIDTACSSSLVAVHQACASLQRKETDLCFAGGVNLMLSPEYHIGYCKLGALSSDGHCKAFDADANGFVRSEGGGMIILKRLEDATRDGDKIFGVIAGSALNNDGSNTGYTAPNPLSQEKLLRDALTAAHINPEDVSYIEAHGTGTKVGDPAELKAIAGAFSGRTNPLMVGSVKTVIGHTEAAAGMAGLIKIILNFRNDLITANDHFSNPNPDINWNELCVRVVSQNTAWPKTDKPRVAGVSAFGLSGTNAHVIILEPPVRQNNPQTIVRPESECMLLPLSARSFEALQELTKHYSAILSSSLPSGTLSTLIADAALRRSHFDYRYAVAGKTEDDIKSGLEHFINSSHANKIIGGEKKVVFVFPGQGSQWIGMGRELFATRKVFRNAILECEKALSEFVDWSLVNELNKDEDSSRFSDVDVIQPVIFSIQVSLAVLWESLGVSPAMVIGHSMGEVAAAHIAGTLSLTDAARIITFRSKLAGRLSGKGAMAVAELSMEEALKMLENYDKEVSIAASNAPASVTFSGDSEAINSIIEILTSRQVFCRPIKVDFASHSPQIDLIKDDLKSGLASVLPQPSRIPVFSTVYNSITNGASFGADYWCDNIRKPVLFSQVVEQCILEGNIIFLEISSHPVLLPFIEQCIESGKAGMQAVNKNSCKVAASLKRQSAENEELIGNLGTLYTMGGRIDWKKYYSGKAPSQGPALPRYPWQKEHFWIEDSKQQIGGSLFGHGFLNNYIKYAGDETIHIWSVDVNPAKAVFLKDHKVQNTILFPGAAFTELVLAALKEAAIADRVSIRELKLKNPLRLEDTVQEQLQLSLKINEMESSFRVVSNPFSDKLQNDRIEYMTGLLEFTITPYVDQDHIISSKEYLQYPNMLEADTHYESCDRRSIQYGKHFRNVHAIWYSDYNTVGEINIPADKQHKGFVIHPAILDACLQVSLATAGLSGLTVVPSGAAVIECNTSLEVNDKLYVHCFGYEKGTDTGAQLSRDMNVCNEKGEVYIKIKGLILSTLDEGPQTDQINQHLFVTEWKKIIVQAQEQEPFDGGKTLVFLSDNAASNGLARQLEMAGIPTLTVRKSDQYKTGYTDNVYTCSLRYQEPEDYISMVNDLKDKKNIHINRIVYLWSTEQPAIENLSSDDDLNCLGITYFLQALAVSGYAATPRVYIVTAGSQVVTESDVSPVIHQAPVWGFGRVLYHEYHSFYCTRIDLPKTTGPDNVQVLCHILQSGTKETELAIRDGGIYAARIKKADTISATPSVSTHKGYQYKKAIPYKIVTDEPGLFENLYAGELTRSEPGEEEIEVEVAASGLNFMNVMSALGIYPGYEKGFRSLGLEFAGTVTRVHPSVTQFRLGDKVMGCAENSLSKYVNVHADLVVHKSEETSFEDAAAIPIAFLTAYFSLIVKGQLKKDETVLIHAATGGVGLAAIQVARVAGAKIIATAGTEEKRNYLKELGIELVFDSRSTEFAELIRAEKSVEGVDVILNSLTGAAMMQSLSLLKPFGRFVEIGKKDVYSNSKLNLSLFKNNISYSFIDLDELIQKRRAYAGELLRGIVSMIERKMFSALPKKVFDISDVAEGFEYMAKGRHIGKIVFNLQGNEDMEIRRDEKAPVLFDQQDNILITGGAGGLGMELISWLAAKGLKNMTIVGRNKPSDAVLELIAQYHQSGIGIHSVEADVADFTAMQDVFKQTAQALPFTGIFHLAGLLDDVSVQKMSRENLLRVMRPKISGAWNLHLLGGKKLKWFVLYSSAASILGTSGQGNYAAANAFLDALCEYRRSQNLPATAVNWGPVAEAGLAAQSKIRGQRLKSEGLDSLSLKEFREVISLIHEQSFHRICAMKLDVTTWCNHNPTYKGDSLFANLLQTGNGQVSQNIFRTKLNAAVTKQEYTDILEQFLKDTISLVLKMNKAKIDNDVPFVAIGMDSLMAIQFRNRLQHELGITVSVTVFWNYPTIRLLTGYFCDVLAMDKQFSFTDLNGTNDFREIHTMTIEEISDELDKALNEIK
jgi:acyl transferase domain-containing protein/acyl carrier protein